MSTGIIQIIKQASLEAVENGQPTDLRQGVVVGVNPLKIKITQQLILSENVLIVPQHLTNYTLNVKVDWNTNDKSGGSGEGSFDSHNHALSGTKTITINNALQLNDKVALLKQKGGQSYFVLDRI